MLRALVAAVCLASISSVALADIPDAAARACGVSPGVIAASHAARGVLGNFDRSAAFADRGAGGTRIIEFTDYSCPSCRALHPHWVALARANRNVRISVVEYPIYGRTLVSQVTGNRTLDASRVAVAAGAQGKQLAFHDALMSIPGQVNDRSIRLAAQRAGLDMATTESLARTRAIGERVDGNLRLGNALGFVGTPNVIVDGVLLSTQPGWTLDQADCLIRASQGALRS